MVPPQQSHWCRTGGHARPPPPHQQHTPHHTPPLHEAADASHSVLTKGAMAWYLDGRSGSWVEAKVSTEQWCTNACAKYSGDRVTHFQHLPLCTAAQSGGWVLTKSWTALAQDV
jgi:hypothetical protein